MFRAESGSFLARLPKSLLALGFATGLLATPAAAQQPGNIVGLIEGGQEQVFAYIYITPAEVRCELLLPLRLMEQWVPIPRARPDRLEIAEQEAARAQLEEFFRTANPVTIDGVPVRPVLRRLDFSLVDTRDPGLQQVLRPVDTADSWVGAVLSYNPAGPPANLRLDWTMFNDEVIEVTALVFAFDQQSRKTFTPGEATFEWAGTRRAPPKLTAVKLEPAALNYRLPVFSLLAFLGALGAGACGLLRPATRAVWRRQAWLLLISAAVLLPAAPVPLPAFVKVHPPVQAADAEAIFETLHRNIYRAFDYRTESDVYDALAHSVHGDLLRRLYQDIHQSLEMKEQGRAISRVSAVRVTDGKLAPPPPGQARNTTSAFRYDAIWTVSGIVGHWGHSHERTNRYHAIFTIELVGAAWKITALEILNEERLEIKLLS